jgi:hypothetical protein
VRYFGQTPDYWLDTCTLPDWLGIWNRELIEQPPPESFLSDYFDYKPPTGATEESEEYTHGLPEFEE